MNTKRDNIEIVLENDRNSSMNKSPCTWERKKERANLNKDLAI